MSRMNVFFLIFVLLAAGGDAAPAEDPWAPVSNKGAVLPLGTAPPPSAVAGFTPGAPVLDLLPSAASITPGGRVPTVAEPVNATLAPLAPNTIFGTDDRLRVPAALLTQHPWRTIVNLQMSRWLGRTGGSCSGAVIHRYFILTSAHCVYFPRNNARGIMPGFVDNIWVFPGRDTDTWPYGRVWATGWWVPSRFIQEAQVGYSPTTPYDWALVELAVPIGDRTGWMGMSSEVDYNGPINTAGYPGDRGNGVAMFRTGCPHGDWDGSDDEFNTMCDLWPGQSGSPIWVMRQSDNQRYIVGVFNWERPSVNGGKVINSDVWNFIWNIAPTPRNTLANPCSIERGGCNANATCSLVGGFVNCDCPGTGTGTGWATCLRNPCHRNGPCSPFATCTATPSGGASCRCRPGYTGTGRRCASLCTVRNGGCARNATCSLTAAGTTRCACNAGFFGNGRTCTNPCSTGNGGCSRNARCTATSATAVTCACNAGYTGNGRVCNIRPNPCLKNNGGCDTQATCTNNKGTAVCTCRAGFVGDGRTCSVPNPCETNNGGCSADATCTNSKGTAACACRSGFVGDGRTCTPADPCATSNGGCHANATCTNNAGTAVCACRSGFAGNGIVCAPNSLPTFASCGLGRTCCPQPLAQVNQSTPADCESACLARKDCELVLFDPLDGICYLHAGCTNHREARAEAALGVRPGASCPLTEGCPNPCVNGNGGCSKDATCTDVGGTAACACNKGFVGDGITCVQGS
ncbi:trypsin-like cysteine/serine peptidase domain-containing protein [Hyaloraphidium curvatum]|nr:trypsin-like cysteine/serine peptidase domain-containing protein [Hyaloraphidium curvatum]